LPLRRFVKGAKPESHTAAAAAEQKQRDLDRPTADEIYALAKGKEKVKGEGSDLRFQRSASIPGLLYDELLPQDL
jgi:hypothetical protein